jgi:hypothetical protein
MNEKNYNKIKKILIGTLIACGIGLITLPLNIYLVFSDSNIPGFIVLISEYLTVGGAVSALGSGISMLVIKKQANKKGIIFDEDRPQLTLIKQEEKTIDSKENTLSSDINVSKLTPKEYLERVKEWLLNAENKIGTSLGFYEEEQNPDINEVRGKVLKFNPDDKEDK